MTRIGRAKLMKKLDFFHEILVVFDVAHASRDFHDFLTFLESDQGASRTLLGYAGRVLEWLRASWNDFRASIKDLQNDETWCAR